MCWPFHEVNVAEAEYKARRSRTCHRCKKRWYTSDYDQWSKHKVFHCLNCRLKPCNSCLEQRSQQESDLAAIYFQ